MAEQTLNIPQLIAVVLVGFLAIRWFLTPSAAQSGSGSNAGRQVNPAHVDQILQMFPTLDQRSIIWDLQRNGGSVQATTERLLSGRALDSPPPSFQPQIPNSTPAVPATTRPRDFKAPLPDLITRYNLSSKIASAPTDDGSSTSGSNINKGKAWSQNKSDRSELLKRRREEMILAARRKMEEQDKKKNVPI